MKLDTLRNFCIIAHIDHGKSTLADRLLEITGTVSSREMRDQMLDSHSIERERGITIKAKAVRMAFEGRTLNLIDTPGHVDFSYEVSRSLAACEGAILLVDATQGVQAQTVANALLAKDHHLKIVPVINKIDLTNARTDEVAEEMHKSLGVDPADILQVSAKTGLNVEEMLREVVARVPPPEGDPAGSLRALIFDSIYDDYRGVIMYVRVVSGTLKKGDVIRFFRIDEEHEIEEVGVFRPKMDSIGELPAGTVGYAISNIKSIRDVHVGDTIIRAGDESTPALPGYKDPKPMVFCGFYPAIGTSFDAFRKALEKLSLNDSSFTYQADTSEALGLGYRCGFLGLLHMDILMERLERDMGVSVIKTAPNVTYEILVNRGEKKEIVEINNPAMVPDAGLIEEWHEPYVRLSLVIPATDMGGVLKLCEDRRGIYVKTEYLSAARAIVSYEMPFPEMIIDFYDRYKSVTHGFGSMDYQLIGFFPSELCKLSILVGGIEVDALCLIVHKDRSEQTGRRIIRILQKAIPRQMFQVSLQAAIGSRIVAREDIRAMAKNVIAKCYGGDVSRKRKLLEKQKEGKKKMKSIGRVEIPQEAFMAVLRATASDDS